jgi:hypothetical protein
MIRIWIRGREQIFFHRIVPCPYTISTAFRSSRTVQPTLGRLFRPARRKYLAAEEKFGPLVSFSFFKAFCLWKQTFFVYVMERPEQGDVLRDRAVDWLKFIPYIYRGYMNGQLCGGQLFALRCNEMLGGGGGCKRVIGLSVREKRWKGGRKGRKDGTGSGWEVE